MEEDYALNIKFCVKLVIPFIFTSIPRVKTGLFYKTNSVSLVVYLQCHGTLNSATIRSFGLCHLYNPITAVRWPSRGKFVDSLADILFMAYHTKHNVNTIVCGFAHVKFWSSGKDLFFAVICETHGAINLLCCPWQPQSTRDCKVLAQL